MAEGVNMECPPTPEGQFEFPDTPPSTANQSNHRIREFLKKEYRPFASSSRRDLDVESSGDEQQRAQDTPSPPPNCSICLGRVKNKCFTDSCMHQFCFSCLLEWSKVSSHFIVTKNKER